MSRVEHLIVRLQVGEVTQQGDTCIAVVTPLTKRRETQVQVRRKTSDVRIACVSLPLSLFSVVESIIQRSGCCDHKLHAAHIAPPISHPPP